ncbi:F-box/kelch-repeat protein SKIP25 [Capsicum annuum]|uniref:F-box/kelch-repeat protein SKIP25 n=1 Tax=Capsicum annuum TaxID=4072 RepID=UPI001FB114F1|nr:F-box/kelch-repeat protein SKIP25 [Capsicum annuum]KAF3614321.1 F-box/kelch-repeat protein SKIP25 [Capsicum annuum]KAF3615405.1 F-box/kelch-repeat protein SKIP25 [Capsicum annuum]
MKNSTAVVAVAAAKRHKILQHDHDDQQSLIPGLPDHIAQEFLNSVHPFTLFSVCHSWRKLIHSPSFLPYLCLYSLLLPTKPSKDVSETLATFTNSVEFACFDPISSKWMLLPPPPPPPPPDPPLRLLVKHPSFISRNMPIQTVSVSGKLILLAATADHFLPAFPRPLIFSPRMKSWSYGPSLANPRRWCAAGVSGSMVYVASGVGSHYNPEVARSVVKWDLNESSIIGPNGAHDCQCKQKQCCLHHSHPILQSQTIFEEFNVHPSIFLKSSSNRDSNYTCVCCANNNNQKEGKSGWKWEEMSGLKDGKFSREAIEAIGWRGKLCMVNVKGDAAKQGIIYNVGSDTWQEMPEGMLAGWRGPAAAMEEETLYTVDESKGALRRYDEERDIWVEVIEHEMLKGAEYVAAAGGRVCIVGRGGSGIVVVDVVAEPPRSVVVDTPVGFQVLNIHILPRMSQLD